MTGDRSRIAEATNELMRTSNLSHIVSISGLPMAMLAGFVYAALRLALVGAQGAGLLPAGVAWHKVAALAALLPRLSEVVRDIGADRVRTALPVLRELRIRLEGDDD